MQRRTLLVSAAVAAIGGPLLAGCSTDPVQTAQRRADRALPGRLEVLEAHTEPGGLLGSTLVATYRVLEDPDAGFTTEKLDEDALTLSYHEAIWRAAELRRLEAAFAADGRELTAFVAEIDENPRAHLSAWVPSAAETDLVAECRRLDAVLQQWGGPDLRLPGGPRPRRRAPGTIDRLEGYSLTLGLLPAAGASGLPAPLDRPRYLRQSDEGRTTAADAAVRSESLVLSQDDASPRSVWVSIEPRMTTTERTDLQRAGQAAAAAWLAEHDPTLRVTGTLIDWTRYDGRLDRIRMYFATCPPGSTCIPHGPQSVVALSVDPDGGEPGEQVLLSVDRAGLVLPLEPERLP